MIWSVCFSSKTTRWEGAVVLCTWIWNLTVIIKGTVCFYMCWNKVWLKHLWIVFLSLKWTHSTWHDVVLSSDLQLWNNSSMEDERCGDVWSEEKQCCYSFLFIQLILIIFPSLWLVDLLLKQQMCNITSTRHQTYWGDAESFVEEVT